jgi:hypothetical protein
MSLALQTQPGESPRLGVKPSKMFNRFKSSLYQCGRRLLNRLAAIMGICKALITQDDERRAGSPTAILDHAEAGGAGRDPGPGERRARRRFGARRS